KIRQDEPLSPRRLQRSIPRDLETICLNCLHKQPGRRYGSAGALADDLRRFLHGEPIQARPTPAWERAWVWCRRHPACAALGALAGLLVCLSLIGYGAQQYQEQQRLARLRQQVDQLIAECSQAVEQQDNRTAHSRILAAMIMIQREPALSNRL